MNSLTGHFVIGLTVILTFIVLFVMGYSHSPLGMHNTLPRRVRVANGLRDVYLALGLVGVPTAAHFWLGIESVIALIAAAIVGLFFAVKAGDRLAAPLVKGYSGPRNDGDIAIRGIMPIHHKADDDTGSGHGSSPL